MIGVFSVEGMGRMPMLLSPESRGHKKSREQVPAFLLVNVLTEPAQPSAELTGSTASSVSLSSTPTGRKLRYFSSFLWVILTV
jgi:hypothetical protein